LSAWETGGDELQEEKNFAKEIDVILPILIRFISQEGSAIVYREMKGVARKLADSLEETNLFETIDLALQLESEASKALPSFGETRMINMNLQEQLIELRMVLEKI
jgi:spore coat protein CotH